MLDPFDAFVDLDPHAIGGTGPLTGLSIGIKSNIAVKGLPWTGGMGTRRDVIAQHDAAVVAQLRAAGAKIPGTLNMHEAALGATTDNVFYGRTLNPHRDGYTPGGSSGGSAAAVAAGLVDAALGTDTLGSVRIPAAYCGVYALKPTLGAVSTDGLVPLGSAFDVIGPLARNLDVLEQVWQVISGTSDNRAASESRHIFTLTNLAGVQVQPAMENAYRNALAALGPSTELSLADTPTAIRTAALVEVVAELKDALGDKRHGPLVSDELKSVIAAVEKIPPTPDVLVRTRSCLIEALGDNGILIMPTAPQVAFAHGTRAPANQADFTALASVAGLPAIAIPAGLDDDRLPVGIQIVGRPNSEAMLFAVARELDAKLSGYTPPPAT